jgi:glyoxylase-like metal-dependent hydrolase (beta-lactamase superfamily II)
MRSIGKYKIGIITLESFALDGGAMFGSVPKVIWEKHVAPDENNRIPLLTRVLVIEGPDGRTLVDCGNGEKWNEKSKEIFKISPLSTLPVRDRIKDIRQLVLTHLHFDHAGGSVYLDNTGNPQLSFPNAKHILQSANWSRANSPGVREKASYLQDTVKKLEDSDLLLVEDGHKLNDCISLHRADGHTQGLQWVLIEDEKETVAYPSDLVPTSHHISIPFVMGYDLCAETTMNEKEKFLSLASQNNWLIIFEHDRDVAGGRVRQGDDHKFIFTKEELSDLEISESAKR